MSWALLLASGLVHAANYDFSSASRRPTCVGGNWTNSGLQWTCNGSFSLASGDTILTSTAMSITANAGITLLGNNSVGSSTSPVSLAATYGDITINGTSTIYGNLTALSGDVVVSNSVVTGTITTTSGNVSLSSATLNGNIATSSGGDVTIIASTVNGSISSGGILATSGGAVTGHVSASNGVTAINSTVFGGNVSASNGPISLYGGSVTGGLSSACCTITATNVAIGGGVSTTVISSSNNTITLTGCTVAGAISSSGGSGVVITNSTMTSGSITTTSVPISISGSTIGTAASPVNIVSNNAVTLTNTTVYGSVTAGSWSTALVADNSTTVYGVCSSDYSSTTKPSQYPRCTTASGTAVARFNACHNYASSTCSTAAGRLYTQRAGASFTTDIVALKADGTVDTSFNGKAVISIIAKAAAGATLDAQNCFTADASQTIDNAVTSFVSGRLTLSSSVATATPDARFRIACDATNCGASQAGVVACSADDFAIRPGSFSNVSASANADASGTSSTATPTVASGRAFSLTATASAGYNGTPKLNTTLVSAHGSATATGSVFASFASANATTGIATAASATYSEVGYFRLGVNAIYDDSFAFVDIAKGDCTGDYSNVAVSGKIGCYFGNATQTSYFGRFVPDHFSVVTASPTAACTSGIAPFTYFGQDGFATPFVLTAQNAGDGTTQNYTGSFARLDLSSWSAFGFATSAALPSGAVLSASATPPSGTWNAGAASVLAKHQISRPATAVGETAVTITARPVDKDGVTSPSAVPVQSSATPLRFGRLRLISGQGSELAPYVVRSEAQYWTGSYWQTNIADSCTSYASANVALSGTTGTTVSGVSPLANGFGSITLARPSAAGKATVCLDMASSADGCAATTPAAIDYLRGNWTSAAYTADPGATVLFGGAALNTRGNWGYLYRRESF